MKPPTPIKDAIAGLKSGNWYTQNPALTKITDADIVSADNDSLFILGRNIYQAACGGAKVAIAYIDTFYNKKAETSINKYKAILDGMLFEVFFNSKGEIRSDFKVSKFNNLFELIKVPEFAPSFEFISELLINYNNRFYVIPGKQRSVSIDVIAELKGSGEYLITGVFFEGTNVLRKLGGVVDELGAYPIRHEKFIQSISNEMVIPITQLQINANYDSTSKLLFPYGATLEK